jgi:hypothetical protein
MEQWNSGMMGKEINPLFHYSNIPNLWMIQIELRNPLGL